MSNNNTVVDNSIVVNINGLADCYATRFFCRPTEYIGVTILIFSTTTFIIGILSWIIIKRHFKNFLFLIIIWNNMLNISLSLSVKHLPASNDAILKMIPGLLYIYFKLTIQYWLVVLCYVFYVDLVKVFNNDVKRKYLKCNLFAWGLPALITFFNAFVMRYADKTNRVSSILTLVALFSPLLINLGIYIRVILCLLQTKVTNGNVKRRSRIQIATVIFSISGIGFLLMVLRIFLTFPLYLSIVLLYLQPSVVLLYFFIMKLNRATWKGHYNNKKRIHLAQIGLPSKNPGRSVLP